MNFKNGKELLAAALADAEVKVKVSTKTRLILGFVAGVQIALAAVAAGIMAFDLPYVGLQKLVFGAVFTAALIMIVIAGTELFTGNVNILVGVLDKRVRVGQYLKAMALAYVSNVAGGIFAAWTINLTNLWGTGGGKYGAYVLQTALNKVSFTPLEAIVMGIYCNFLVCSAIWISRASSDGAGKVLTIFFPILLFAGTGFEHSMANAYLIPAGIFAKGNAAAVAAFANPTGLAAITWKGFFINNLLPVTVGNWLGGGILLGTLLYFALREKQ